MRLETERLILRPIEESDKQTLVEIANNQNVSCYMTTLPFPYKDSDADWWVNEVAKKEKKDPRESYELSIILKKTQKLIGGIGLIKVSKDKVKAEIGCWLGEPYWRKGYMSEASKKLIDFAFNELGIGRIEWQAHPENTGSNELAKSLGFLLEGTKRKSVKSLSTGEIFDANFYGLLKEEWKP